MILKENFNSENALLEMKQITNQNNYNIEPTEVNALSPYRKCSSVDTLNSGKKIQVIVILYLK